MTNQPLGDTSQDPPANAGSAVCAHSNKSIRCFRREIDDRLGGETLNNNAFDVPNALAFQIDNLSVNVITTFVLDGFHNMLLESIPLVIVQNGDLPNSHEYHFQFHRAVQFGDNRQDSFS